MDRLKNLLHVGAAAADYAASDSPVTSEYNWNDLSFGNDTINCDRFFRKYSVFFVPSIASNAFLSIYNLTSKYFLFAIIFALQVLRMNKQRTASMKT